MKTSTDMIENQIINGGEGNFALFNCITKPPDSPVVQ